LPGVKEDLVEISLNLKKVKFDSYEKRLLKEVIYADKIDKSFADIGGNVELKNKVRQQIIHPIKLYQENIELYETFINKVPGELRAANVSEGEIEKWLNGVISSAVGINQLKQMNILHIEFFNNGIELVQTMNNNLSGWSLGEDGMSFSDQKLEAQFDEKYSKFQASLEKREELSSDLTKKLNAAQK
jgi:hypothetical protein